MDYFTYMYVYVHVHVQDGVKQDCDQDVYL